jgi:hypothetical protein
MAYLLDSCERWVPGGRTSAAQQAHGNRGRIDHSNPLNFNQKKCVKVKKTRKEKTNFNHPFKFSYMRLEEIERLPNERLVQQRTPVQQIVNSLD